MSALFGGRFSYHCFPAASAEIAMRILCSRMLPRKGVRVGPYQQLFTSGFGRYQFLEEALVVRFCFSAYNT